MAEKLNHIRLAWAGGVHWFDIEAPEPPIRVDSQLTLTIEQIRRGQAPHVPAPLHDRAGAVLKRLTSGFFGQDDLGETIRCGLIGGGELEARSAEAEWEAAAALVQEHVYSRPLAESLTLAQAILCALIYGVDADTAEQGLDPATIPLKAFGMEEPANG